MGLSLMLLKISSSGLPSSERMMSNATSSAKGGTSSCMHRDAQGRSTRENVSHVSVRFLGGTDRSAYVHQGKGHTSGYMRHAGLCTAYPAQLLSLATSVLQAHNITNPSAHQTL